MFQKPKRRGVAAAKRQPHCLGRGRGLSRPIITTTVFPDGSLAVLCQAGGRDAVLNGSTLNAGPVRGTIVNLRETHLPRRGLQGVPLSAAGLR